MNRLGCIADDFTGAADVAVALRRAGLRTVLFFGQPQTSPPGADAVDAVDAVIVALKIRSVPPDEAVRASLAVERWLATPELYFKYCSTFDSTDAGNIGPVADALLDALGLPLTVVCPASPEHGRTVYKGHLFVGDRLLSESPMRYHPLNPMTDSDLLRVLGRQTRYGVGLVPHEIVRQGPEAVDVALKKLVTQGIRHAVTDAICEADLTTIATASQTLGLRTGAAGLARAIGELMDTEGATDAGPPLPDGPAVILAGSCSPATLAQVAHFAQSLPICRLDPAYPHRATAWLEDHVGDTPTMVYSSVPPHDRRATDAPLVERAMAQLAQHAVYCGARRIVVAGGETSGAVVEALRVEAVTIGDEVDPGVPWLVSTGHSPLALLLKSGNFGSPDLFVRAVEPPCSS